MIIKYSVFISFIGVLSLSLYGCNTDTPEEIKQIQPETNSSISNVATDSSKPDSSETKNKGEISAEVPLEIRSWKEVQAWIAQQQGKVVVVDLWSTYCEPCRREFPHFVAFHNRSAAKVTCASLSLDFYGGSSKPEDAQPVVQKFLATRKATMKNFISSTPDSGVLKDVDSFAVPVSLVYDQDGKLNKIFNNDGDEYGSEGFSYQKDIVPYVEKLLGSK